MTAKDGNDVGAKYGWVLPPPPAPPVRWPQPDNLREGSERRRS